MKCPDPEELLAYIEGGPSQVSRARARHIQRCKTCAAQIAELREVGDVLRPRATPAAPVMDAMRAQEAPRRRRGVLPRKAMRIEETVAYEVSEADVAACPPAEVEPAAAEQAEVIERARQRFLRHLDTEGAALRLRGAVSDLLHRLSDLMGTHPGLAPGHRGEVAARMASTPIAHQSLDMQLTDALHVVEAGPAEDLNASLASLSHAIIGAFGVYSRNEYQFLRRPETAEPDRAEMMDIVRRTIDLWEGYFKAAPDESARSEAKARIAQLREDLERLGRGREPERP